MVHFPYKEVPPMKNKKMSDKTRSQLIELIDEWIFDERGRNVLIISALEDSECTERAET